MYCLVFFHINHFFVNLGNDKSPLPPPPTYAYSTSSPMLDSIRHDVCDYFMFLACEQSTCVQCDAQADICEACESGHYVNSINDRCKEGNYTYVIQ